MIIGDWTVPGFYKNEIFFSIAKYKSRYYFTFIRRFLRLVNNEEILHLSLRYF